MNSLFNGEHGKITLPLRDMKALKEQHDQLTDALAKAHYCLVSTNDFMLRKFGTSNRARTEAIEAAEKALIAAGKMMPVKP